jgi:hypothetical protein
LYSSKFTEPNNNLSTISPLTIIPLFVLLKSGSETITLSGRFGILITSGIRVIFSAVPNISWMFSGAGFFL